MDGCAAPHVMGALKGLRQLFIAGCVSYVEPCSTGLTKLSCNLALDAIDEMPLLADTVIVYGHLRCSTGVAKRFSSQQYAYTVQRQEHGTQTTGSNRRTKAPTVQTTDR